MRFVKGITLIEILVPLSIIAILAALLVPAFMNAKKAAERSDRIASSAYKQGASIRIKANGKKGVVHHVGSSFGGDMLLYKVSYVDDCGHVSEAEILQTEVEAWRN